MAPEVDIPLNAELPDNTIEPRDLPNHACTQLCFAYKDVYKNEY